MKRSSTSVWPGRIRRILLLLAALYLVAGGCLYFFQEKLLFKPEVLGAGESYQLPSHSSIEWIPFNSTDTMYYARFLPETPPRGVVLFFHGNMQHIQRYVSFTQTFTRKGYEVWMPDYPGYGKSTGERTEKKMYQQAVQLYQLAALKYPVPQLIIYGRSLGTGVAAYLASVKPAHRLILETPYSSIPDLFFSHVPVYPMSWIARFQFPVKDFLVETTMPVAIFHGTSDGVVPIGCARRLKARLKKGDVFTEIESGSHMDLGTYPQYHRVLDSLLQY